MKREIKLGKGYVRYTGILGVGLYTNGMVLVPIKLGKEFRCFCKNECKCSMWELIVRKVK